MFELLGVDVKKLDDGGFQFYQTGLIRKFFEATVIVHFNGFTAPTKVGAPLETDDNGYKAKRNWTNSYDSVIWMMLYLESNTRPDIPLGTFTI